MKFGPFEYVRAATLQEAFEELATDEDAKVLAGGQSLLPLMALRLARPSVLVDITGLSLDGVRLDADGKVIRLGAMVRHRVLEESPRVAKAAPLLTAAVRHVGHWAIRNRGTLGGSLAHADPAGELPVAALALGATAVIAGPRGVRRTPCAELVEGYFTTSLDRDEIITQIDVPAASDGHSAAFCEWAPRAGDFAEVGVGVAIDLTDGGCCERVRAAACGVGSVPLDLGPVLARTGVEGANAAEPTLLRAVASAVTSAAASAGDDKAALAGLLAARGLAQAFVQANNKAVEVRA